MLRWTITSSGEKDALLSYWRTSFVSQKIRLANFNCLNPIVNRMILSVLWDKLDVYVKVIFTICTPVNMSVLYVSPPLMRTNIKWLHNHIRKHSIDVGSLTLHYGFSHAFTQFTLSRLSPLVCAPSIMIHQTITTNQ